MRYYKNISNGYVFAISAIYGETKLSETKISESEYYELLSVIRNRPSAPDGYDYKLRADNLEWELVKLPPVEPEPVTDEEALTRFSNTITGANDPDLISAAETLIEQRIKEES